MNPPPQMLPFAAQEAVDRSHLQLLSIFHYIMAGFCALGLVFIGIHCAIMMSVAVPAIQQEAQRNPAAAQFPIAILVVMYVVLALLAIAMGIAEFFAAQSLRSRRNRTFTMVVAGFNCLSFPLGTALGVFTFIVLSRPSVQALYQREPING